MKKCFKFEVLLVCFMLLLGTVSVSAESFVYYDMETGEQTEQEIQVEEGEVFSPTKSFVGNATKKSISKRSIVGENTMIPVHDVAYMGSEYAKVCWVYSEWEKNGSYHSERGSGIMIGKNQVLTAGHCVYNYERGIADNIVVAPGKHINKLYYGSSKAIKCSYPEDLKKLNYKDSSTIGYQKSDLAVITLASNLGDKCGFASVGYLTDSTLMALPSRQLTITGYPEAGIELGFFDEIMGASHTFDGVMYSTMGYTTRCSGRQILYNVDTGQGMDGAAIMCLNQEILNQVVVGVDVSYPRETKGYNVGVHIENTHMKWLQSLGVV